MMFCGPDGGTVCFSLLGKEMVKSRNVQEMFKTFNNIYQDCVMMTGYIMMTASSSLLFCVLTSTIRF